MINRFRKWQARRRFQAAEKVADAVASEVFSILGDEWPYDNPDELVGRKGRGIYREMVNNDAEIRGTLKEIVYSVIGTQWSIKESEPDNDAAIEQKDFVESNLLNLGGESSAGLTFQTAKGFLYELIMEAITSGYGIWDRVPRFGDSDRIEIHVLKGKQPDDYEFLADKYGNLTGIQFQVHGEITDIEPGEFVIFPWLNFYANWYGTSELRCLYGYYALNKIILKMAGIFSAKLAGGIWKATYPSADLSKVALLKRVLRAASSTGILDYPEVVEIENDKLASGEGDNIN